MRMAGSKLGQRTPSKDTASAKSGQLLFETGWVIVWTRQLPRGHLQIARREGGGNGLWDLWMRTVWNKAQQTLQEFRPLAFQLHRLRHKLRLRRQQSCRGFRPALQSTRLRGNAHQYLRLYRRLFRCQRVRQTQLQCKVDELSK